jgi:hypothetical protein
MPKWQRTRGKYLAKTAKITDGEMLHLLLGQSPYGDDQLDERFYQSFQAIRSSTFKSIFWIIGACAFGVLSHFGVLKSASASGLEVSPTIFSHTALLALSFSTASFCFVFCKQTYIQSWFSWKMKSGTPAQKAKSLLMFPEAYWHFNFLPSAIGYPQHIIAKRAAWGQLLYLFLVLASLAIFSMGSIALWIMLVTDVWYSTGINGITSTLTIALSGVVTLLGWTSPFSYDFSRNYTHHGLVNLLHRRQGEKLTEAHVRIYLAAQRMDLVEPTNPGSK